jgi:hypothetical protein
MPREPDTIDENVLNEHEKLHVALSARYPTQCRYAGRLMSLEPLSQVLRIVTLTYI